MSTKAGDIGDCAATSDNKLYQTVVNQPAVTHATEKLSGESVNFNVNPITFIAELDSTPIQPKMAPLSPSSHSPKTSISDVTVMVVGDGNYEDYEMLAGEKPAVAHLIEKVASAKAAKMKDPACLVNLPTTPSAHAYEVAQNAKSPGDVGYFDPVYAEIDDSPADERVS